MKWNLIWILLVVLPMAYGIDYTAPDKDSVTFVFDQSEDYTAPNKDAVTFIFEPVLINITAPEIVQACGTTTIFHNQNLS